VAGQKILRLSLDTLVASADCDTVLIDVLKGSVPLDVALGGGVCNLPTMSKSGVEDMVMLTDVSESGSSELR
jgi:hypothetical protein